MIRNAVLIYCLFVCVFFTACQSKVVLRTDGFYQSPKAIYQLLNIESYYHYIQFFEDDTAIDVSSTGEAWEVMDWFSKEKGYTSKGRYSAENGRIFYTAKSKYGNVLYRIKIKANKLQVSSHSLINGNRNTRTYRFIPFESAQQN